MPNKYGVHYDLETSPYRVTWRHFEFRFTSANHMEKFAAKTDVRTDWLSDSLSRRFHFAVDADLIAVLQLYIQTETRGFFVADEVLGTVYTDKDKIMICGWELRSWE